MSSPLACPRCATAHGLDVRFCPRCGMPLVYNPGLEEGPPITERHARARKIKPQYAEGDLVRVAHATNQAEGEFIQSLLLEEGVPSMMRRAAGFDVPDFLAAGPRDVLVPASGADAAREILLAGDLGDAVPTERHEPAGRLLGAILASAALIALVVWLGMTLVD